MILWLQLVAKKRLCRQIFSIVDVRPGRETTSKIRAHRFLKRRCWHSNVLGVLNDFRISCGVRFLMNAQLLISVIDDDESFRESLPELLKELGFTAWTFSSAEEFLVSDAASQSSCLILDVAMPAMSGPDLLRELRRRKLRIPVVFITARRDEIARSQMLSDGAVECLFKPFSDIALLQALNKAIGEQQKF
jgi:CheY-like chemotaxis protein